MVSEHHFERGRAQQRTQGGKRIGLATRSTEPDRPLEGQERAAQDARVSSRNEDGGEEKGSRSDFSYFHDAISLSSVPVEGDCLLVKRRNVESLAAALVEEKSPEGARAGGLPARASHRLPQSFGLVVLALGIGELSPEGLTRLLVDPD